MYVCIVAVVFKPFDRPKVDESFREYRILKDSMYVLRNMIQQHVFMYVCNKHRMR